MISGRVVDDTVSTTRVLVLGCRQRLKDELAQRFPVPSSLPKGSDGQRQSENAKDNSDDYFGCVRCGWGHTCW